LLLIFDVERLMSQLKHKNYSQIKIALTSEDFDAFTVKSLIAKLLHQNDDARCFAGNRKAIYRTLIAMVKSGELCKKVASNPRESTFHKTPVFAPEELLNISKLKELTESVPVLTNPIDTNERSIKYLASQLKEYQISLLASIGESEEYKTLFTTLPGMHLQLEELYIKAREKSSTLLGQITAINNVLSHCKSSAVL